MKSQKYDVGILSFWNVPNYGTFAQAYALQKTCESFGVNAKQIAYLDKKHYNTYYSWIPPYSILSKKFYCEFPKRIYPMSRYNRRKRLFIESYGEIPHTEVMTKRQLLKSSYDVVVLGSDIIWDYSFEVFNHDVCLFGNKLQAKKVVSYAASFGTIKIDDKHPCYVRRGIKALNAISVRDENSAEIVEMLVGNRPPVVLDPTWLWDFSTDSNVVEPNSRNYMVVYGQDFTTDFIEQAQSIARDKQLKLVCLDCNDDNYDWCDVVIKQYQLKPFEWIGLFKGAHIIVTSTYHGLMFGLIFNKQLAFCKSDFIMAKASCLLEKIGLYEVYKNSSVEEMLIATSDYSNINKILQEEKNISLSYLREALKWSEVC